MRPGPCPCLRPVSQRRQTGALVTTLRAGFAEEELDKLQPTLLVLSPGPGCPKDFGLSRTINLAIDRRLPIFGVCLGLQGIVEHFGGELGVLPYPQHGKPAYSLATSSGKSMERVSLA